MVWKGSKQIARFGIAALHKYVSILKVNFVCRVCPDDPDDHGDKNMMLMATMVTMMTLASMMTKKLPSCLCKKYEDDSEPENQGPHPPNFYSEILVMTFFGCSGRWLPTTSIVSHIHGHLNFYINITKSPNYVQNTFWQSGNDSEWFLKKNHFSKYVYVTRDPHHPWQMLF